MSEVIQVQTTVDSKRQAEKLVEAMIEDELAAWGYVTGPVNSTYREEGEVVSLEEWICTLWTSDEAYEALERGLMKKHPYEEPDVVAMPTVDGSRDFIKWIKNATED